MSNIFIIHGTYGHPEENWFPWLKNALENMGHKVFVPALPTPENQTIDNWLKEFEKYEKYINKNTIVVGHSLGATFLLNIIEKYKIKAAFFISGFIGKVDNQFCEDMKSFTQKPYNLKRIKHNCPKFFIFHSNNDPYIRLDIAEKLASYLNTKITLIKNAGHFNAAAGYTTFPLLLETIKTQL